MKLKKLMLSLLTLCLLLPVLAVQTMAATDSGQAGDNVTWTLDSSGTLIISGTGPITEHPWSDDYATVIKRVIIEEGITSIGSGTFSDCIILSELRIPGSVTELEPVSIGCPVVNLCITDLRQWLEMDMDSLVRFSILYVNGEQITELVIPEGITTIYEGAFDDFTTLKSVYIPDSVTSIGKSAFSGCKNLQEVRLSNGLTSIPGWAFADCQALQNITVPASVQAIGQYAFGQNYSGATEPYGLQEIRFEGDAPLIAYNAFTKISATAYYSSTNESWTTDKLQNYNGYSSYGSITWIADDSISDTGGSGEVHIIAQGTCGSNVYWVLDSNGNMVITTTAAYGLRSGAVADMDDYGSPEETPWFQYRDKIKAVTVEAGVNSVGENAFAGCENLAEVTIQDGVADIGESAFQSCESLTEVTFQGSAPSFGENAFAEVEATVHYPAGDSSWNDEVVEEMGGTIELKPDESLHAHSWDAGTVTTEPTATEPGVMTYTCTSCGKTREEEIPASGETAVLWGDVNGDGFVDSFDASLIMKYDVMLIGDGDLNLAAADVSGDGYVDSYDASLILKFDVMLIDKFPVEG